MYFKVYNIIIYYLLIFRILQDLIKITVFFYVICTYGAYWL